MDTFLLGLGLGLLAGAVFFGVALFSRAGGLGRGWWGLSVAGRIGSNTSLQHKIDGFLSDPAAPAQSTQATPPIVRPQPAQLPPATPKRTGEPLQLLALLQGEARLLDTLFSPMKSLEGQKVKDAIIEMQELCQAVLKKYLTIEDILPGEEGSSVTVNKGYDPSAIRVVGNVTGQPPFRGTLNHPGYRVKELKLPAIPDGQDGMVLQPAEVEVA